MRGKSRLFYFIVVLGSLLLITVLFLIIYKYKDMNKDYDYSVECKSYWKDILEKREPDIIYITKWFDDNQSIQFIYNTQEGAVCFVKEDESLKNLDSRITEFVKENEISIEKYIEEEQVEAGSIISFSHEFFEKNRPVGRYCLRYIKNKKAVRDSSDKKKG